MSATIVSLSRKPQRELEEARIPMPIIEYPVRTIARALGGTGEYVFIQPRAHSYLRCRCPLCGGPMRLRNGMTKDRIAVACDDDRLPERVVGEIIRRGLHTVRCGWPTQWREA
jgi:hypothetical protein